jgi:hypothetical protein
MGRHKGLCPDDYRKLADEGLTMSEASARLGVKRQSVWAMSKRYGIAFTEGKKGRKKIDRGGK